MTESSTEKAAPVFSSEMEFSNEELMWFLSLSTEVPDGELTPTEKLWYEIAEPGTTCEAQLFQLLASIRFGLTDLTDIFSTDIIQP